MFDVSCFNKRWDLAQYMDFVAMTNGFHLGQQTTATDEMVHVPNIKFHCEIGNQGYENFGVSGPKEERLSTKRKLSNFVDLYPELETKSESDSDDQNEPVLKRHFQPLGKTPNLMATSPAYRKKYGNLVPCPFMARYKRRDPDDITSNYILDAINPVHNHELQFEITAPSFQSRYWIKDLA